MGALWLWNRIGAVTSSSSNRSDLRSTPEGVLCEPNVDVPGAEKVFCAVENNLEEYGLINTAISQDGDALTGESLLLARAERHSA